MPDARLLPDFAIVGAPRAGTTFMWHYLGQHPQVFMSRVKEPHHYATDLDSGSAADADAFTRDPQTYRAYFAGARAEQLTGEASAWYLYSTRAAAEIHAANPAARIIIQLRDPVQMLYSIHHHRLYTGSEDLVRFEGALAAEAERRAGRRLPPGQRNVSAYFYRDVARLAGQVERYLDEFGRAAVHVLVFEELRADPARAFRSVLEFLGVDPEFAPPFERLNATAERRSRSLQRLISSTAGRRIYRRLLPGSLGDRGRSLAERLNSRPSRRPALDPATEAALREELRADVERLGRLLARDLLATWWPDESVSVQPSPLAAR